MLIFPKETYREVMTLAMAMAAAVAARSPIASSLPTKSLKMRAKWLLTAQASSSYSSTSSAKKKLILYSKPGCCLCDGLKEKLRAAFTVSAPDALHEVELEIRDITSNPEWEKAYQYEIPVLARVRFDGTEETLPRLSPRLGVELIQKKIAAALSQ